MYVDIYIHVYVNLCMYMCTYSYIMYIYVYIHIYQVASNGTHDEISDLCNRVGTSVHLRHFENVVADLCVAVCCSVLQCFAVRCSAMQ